MLVEFPDICFRCHRSFPKLRARGLCSSCYHYVSQVLIPNLKTTEEVEIKAGRMLPRGPVGRPKFGSSLAVVESSDYVIQCMEERCGGSWEVTDEVGQNHKKETGHLIRLVPKLKVQAVRPNRREASDAEDLLNHIKKITEIDELHRRAEEEFNAEPGKEEKEPE